MKEGYKGICAVFFLNSFLVYFFADVNDTYYPVVTLPAYIGVLTSLFLGFAGLRILCFTNVRVVREAEHSLHRGFLIAHSGG